MSGEEANEILDIMEALLTAEIVNQNPALDWNDLTPACRDLYGVNGSSGELKRPVMVSEGAIQRVLGIPNAYERVRKNPFVGYEEFGQRLSITAVEPAARWFLKRGGRDRIQRNPALAYFFERFDSADFSYRAAKESNPLFEDTRSYLDAKISRVIAESEPLRGAMDLLIVSAPEEIEQRLADLVCTPRQQEFVQEIETALQHREFLRAHRIYEIGKILFVGPPGTGKTSLALALSHRLHLPLLEVRLSMITSQYLGETSKNIDRVFEFAKRLSPCILFIDEFDYVAKSRVTDDHGAMKRAVNMLLKNIDSSSLIRDGVLLIGATNHPQLLDEAAWRRFDQVVEFALPDCRMRRDILASVTATLDCRADLDALAARTEGFSGADLRMMVKEAVISALTRQKQEIGEEDMEKGILLVEERNALKYGSWV
ncbi:MAG: ATP-binding protein [Methanomicrobiales archaeon]|nr:ATP-binding protein [Methanomicrobiales archaeon]MDI6875975.1 ATP-binding protein [Methanomicrobiales archaeon]